MNQRMLAAIAALLLVAALAVVALVVPLPYTTYAPGPTIDVLGAPGGKEIIQASGQQTYRDSGQLRMVTVSVTPKQSDLDLVRVMSSWFDRSDAVYPKEAVYPDDKTEEEVRNEGQVEMVSSQDTAIAVAGSVTPGFSFLRAASSQDFTFPMKMAARVGPSITSAPDAMPSRFSTGTIPPITIGN